MSRTNMKKIAIIIPARLDAVRLPNKPLKLINDKEMILHVYEIAQKCNVDHVLVASLRAHALLRHEIRAIGGGKQLPNIGSLPRRHSHPPAGRQ